MKCKGKTALVTGAAGDGIGRSVALTLAREGANVVVNYRSNSLGARAVIEQIQQRGGQAVAMEADIFSDEDCQKLVAACRKQFGRVDICVIGPGAGWHAAPLGQLDAAAAVEDIRQETAPVLHLLSWLLPEMYEKTWGRVIGIGLSPSFASPAYAYNVAKAARTQALLLAADQAWERGVTINVVGPGPMPMIESVEKAVEQCDHGEAWGKRATATPQDIAEGVAFLCSEEARFISGCVLPYRFCQ